MQLQNRKNIKFGNTKLPTTTAIFNLCAAKDCPSLRLGFCQAFYNGKCVCYALRGELRWYHPLTYRRRQEKLWDALTAEEFAGQFLSLVKRRRIRTKALRLNESGDFRSQADVDKASRIAELLAPAGIRVYCYTARRDLDFSGVSPNFVVNGSGFKVQGEFRFILSRKDRPKGYGICPMDCRKCRRCLDGKNTCIVRH
jgi:hypothetical protein